jgi:hypothetical protein
MRNIIIYLDNSLSMSVPVEEKTRALDAGIAMAQRIVDVFPPDTRYQLITNDFAPFSNSYKANAEVADLLTQVRLSPLSRSFDEIRSRITHTRKESSGDVFLISDFQRSTLGEIDNNSFDSLLQWHVVPLQFNTTVNIFCDSAYLENPFVVGGERNTLHIRLRNTGDRAVDQLLVKLSVNGIQAGASSVNIAAQGMAETSFDLTTGLSGISLAVISFNDYPVSFDNEFYLALNFSDKINVLEIKPQATVTPVERVYGNKQVFNTRSFTSANFNYSLLPEADLVVLNELDRIDAGLLQALRTYLDNGGTMLIVPSVTPDMDSYKNLMRTPMLRLTEASQSVELDYPDFNNPFFENVFEERTTRLEMPKANRTLDWGTDRSAILRFKNEQPYLSLLQQRRGKVYVFASPLQSNLSTLSSNALFVPVMYRVAASGKRNELKPYYRLHESYITIRTDSLVGEEPLKLVGEQEVVPAQRRLADQVIMELPRFTMNAGFYRVTHLRDTVGLLAFNLNDEESVLRQYTRKELGQWAEVSKNITMFEANSDEAFSNEIKARYLGKPLWKYAIMIALLFLLAEILLIRFLK